METIETSKEILRRVLFYPANKIVEGKDFVIEKVSVTMVYRFPVFSACVKDVSRDNPSPSISLVSATRPDFILPSWCMDFANSLLQLPKNKYTIHPGMTEFGVSHPNAEETDEKFVSIEDSQAMLHMCTLRAHLSGGRNVFLTYPNGNTTMTGDLTEEDAKHISNIALASIFSDVLG